MMGLWGTFKEYIKENIIMAVLRKANSLYVVICRLILKKINNVNKKIPSRKVVSKFDFSQVA